MEDDLKIFLLERKISSEEIEEMEKQKIDIETVKLMKEEQLGQFLSRYGDRVAVLNFCRQFSQIQSGRKQNLINRLKQKISSKPYEGNKREKNKRRVEVGWLNWEDQEKKYKQVRLNTGGGTRRILITKDAKRNTLLEEAKNLFFPNGKSTKGKLCEFRIKLQDFTGEEISENKTVEQMYSDKGVTILRIYLATKKIPATFTNRSLIDEPYEYDNAQLRVVHQTEEIVNTNLPQRTSTLTDLTNIDLTNLEFDSYNENYSINELNATDVGNWLDENTPPQPETEILTLHRGNVFTEILQYFKKSDHFSSNIKIKMIATNGVEEIGIDFGGILRDSLSEFWETFFEKCSVGSSIKVPCIRHDFGKHEWETIAKILSFGYKKEKYFPWKLSISFISFCLFNKVTFLRQSFLSYIGNADSDVLKEALNSSFEFDCNEELVDIFCRYEAKCLPTKENIHDLLNEIAHKEFIQKPNYIINVWKPILKGLLTEEEVNEIYKTSIPSFRNINEKIIVPESLTTEMIHTLNYMKEFLRESNEDTRCKFIRFCTGADCLIANLPLQIQFSKLDGLERRPIAHTCTATLELPTTYKNLQDFRQEFNSILNANFWNVEIA